MDGVVKVESAGVLEAIAREGVPAEVEAGGNMGKELAFGNYRSALKHWGEVPKKKASTDVAIGREYRVSSDTSTRGERAADLTSWDGRRGRETAGNPRLDVRWPGER